MHLNEDLISNNEIEYYKNESRNRILNVFFECLVSINQVLSNQKNPEIHKTLTEAKKVWDNIYNDLQR